jgi:hypothetical protein
MNFTSATDQASTFVRIAAIIASVVGKFSSDAPGTGGTGGA